MMTTVYISGKITGLPVEEYTANFEYAASIVTLAGFRDVSPLKLWHPFKIWWCYIVVDLIVLCFCDYVYFMDNWKESRGAIIEYKLAMFLHKQIIQL